MSTNTSTLPTQMDLDRRTVGLLFCVISVVLTPVYMRIIHVLLWSSEFQKLRCYRIMALIGILDCVFVLGYAVFGLTLAFENEFYGFTHVIIQLCEAVWMTKCSLNVILAINRLTVICDINVSNGVHVASLIVCWLVGSGFFIVCLSPYAGLRPDYSTFAWIPDYSKPLTHVFRIVDQAYSFSTLSFILVIYLITAYVLFLKRKRFNANRGRLLLERRICLIGLVLFSSPMTGALLFNFGMQILPESYWTTAVIGIFSICNISLAAPTVYLAVNKSLRRQVLTLGFRRSESVSSRVHTINIGQRQDGSWSVCHM